VAGQGKLFASVSFISNKRLSKTSVPPSTQQLLMMFEWSHKRNFTPSNISTFGNLMFTNNT